MGNAGGNINHQRQPLLLAFCRLIEVWTIPTNVWALSNR